MYMYFNIYFVTLLAFQVVRANFNEDPYIQDFGISVDQKMVTVTGRILPPPLLQYGGKVRVVYVSGCTCVDASPRDT